MSNQLRPVNPRSIVDHIVDSLREAILDGSLAPGTKLVERRLAAELGVSTISIREAFARLAEEGLVDRIPRRGAFVASVTPDFIRDLSRVRIVLEQLAVELAIARWNDDFHQRAQAIIHEMRRSISRKPHARRLWELDEEFHALFCEASGSETLQIVLADLHGRIARHLRKAWSQLPPEELGPTVQVHQEWLDAVTARDVALAQRLAEEHIAHSSEDAIARLATETAEARDAVAPA